MLVAQAQPQWCYAAVTVMMRRHHELDAEPITQQQIVTEVNPAANAANMVTDYAIKPGYAWLPGSSAAGAALAWNVLTDLLGRNRPIVYGLPAHYVLITGYRQSRAAGQQLLLWDPLPDKGRRWMSYADYVAGFVGNACTNIWYP